MKPAVLSLRARQDLLDAVRWIARDNPLAARALTESVAAAARRLGDHPESGFARPALADPPARFLVLTGSPYVIVCDAAMRPPVILRVLHGARDLPELLHDL